MRAPISLAVKPSFFRRVANPSTRKRRFSFDSLRTFWGIGDCVGDFLIWLSSWVSLRLSAAISARYWELAFLIDAVSARASFFAKRPISFFSCVAKVLIVWWFKGGCNPLCGTTLQYFNLKDSLKITAFKLMKISLVDDDWELNAINFSKCGLGHNAANQDCFAHLGQLTRQVGADSWQACPSFALN